MGRLSASADISSQTKDVPGGGHAAERPQNRILFGQRAPIWERTR